ncbi:hypothetical protein, unlikely [Trypanosoma brucei gambiense DAL972]|uniref:Uncharacterized protein n=1 Tax=Trypanosoma brucei gambiense (strain MHOM/CI/86/DAL972) TaxID=679716 RepID=C9ZYS1_TRYB9|nr:hypothetical protein, unlikely [Trypanosoma brucei gambiense DAL972]CBH14570.1 hypothetical protein, unlikely [Trypanosoma brucei gambiense DAL972]|eukprot:XP_011776836.1 hypothetical protein, unlikely [Trypanosoma brucei gambiense DAL972]
MKKKYIYIYIFCCCCGCLLHPRYILTSCVCASMYSSYACKKIFSFFFFFPSFCLFSFIYFHFFHSYLHLCVSVSLHSSVFINSSAALNFRCVYVSLKNEKGK